MTKGTCSIDGCSGAHAARGFCQTHYVKARRDGLPNLPRNETWHYGTMPDVEAMLIDCSVCGPRVPMKIYNGRAVCLVPYKKNRKARRDRVTGAGKPNTHPTYKRRRRYGLEMGGPERLLEEAGGTCQICRTELTLETMHIDHDHACCPSGPKLKACGECVRGALCRRCNTALGSFRDNVDTLRAAVEYLERFSSRR